MNNISIIEYEQQYAERAVKMWRISKEKALGFKDEIHSLEDHVHFVTNHLVKTNSVYLAVEKLTDEVIGIIAFDSSSVNQLYIDIDFQNKQIGSALLAIALKNCKDNLQLYTFEVNAQAQSFYEKHGFKIVSRGSCDNEENMPDILYELKY